MKFDFFKNYRLIPETDGSFSIGFVCRECGKVVTDPGHYSIPCSPGGVPEYHLADFVCEDCMNKEE